MTAPRVPTKNRNIPPSAKEGNIPTIIKEINDVFTRHNVNTHTARMILHVLCDDVIIQQATNNSLQTILRLTQSKQEPTTKPSVEEPKEIVSKENVAEAINV